MESLNTQELEKFANSFDSIIELFNEKHKERLLINFQESLKKIFSSVIPNDSISMSKAKLNMWRYNFQVLQKYLEVSLPNINIICEGIINNVLSLAESAVKSWEKEMNNKRNFTAEIYVKQEEINTILLASESLENKVRSLTIEKDTLAQQLKKTQNELATAHELLQRENKAFLNNIIALSKQNTEISIPQSPVKNFRKEIVPKVPNNTIIMNKRIAQGRELSFKQLKDTIEEVYATKVKFDEKCRESFMPIETLDQFMLTYLNQKFGLKTIITEWTFAIMKAITRYENEDAEVKLFSKIINHQIDEDFRYVLYKVKDKIRNLLKAYITSNWPYMREGQVNAHLKEKMQGKLDENEWGSIIISIYSDEESTYMINLVKSHISSKAQPNTKSLKPNNEDISFIEFQNIILSYDLTTHETLLSPFAEMFKQYDQDADGLLTKNEFKEICNSLNVSNKTDEFLLKADPFSLEKISFSACVKIFSDEKTPNSKENFSILHNLFFSKHDDLNI
ncbi:hypothetical protein SteCoe_4035 [Stentor coeruleus]|uniref:EF-hand domain-containing protein n=1 Tax=Stentor coeruleus TaxID=5963 RepID=A0A1R2CVQ4_9CILI|nr:hypothetical protein SteCoe_4035 [Stentor coeruleus]